MTVESTALNLSLDIYMVLFAYQTIFQLAVYKSMLKLYCAALQSEEKPGLGCLITLNSGPPGVPTAATPNDRVVPVTQLYNGDLLQLYLQHFHTL